MRNPPRYQYFMGRYGSFNGNHRPFVDGGISVHDLAVSGFYYYGNRTLIDDAVVCFKCGVGLCAWASGDDVFKEHYRVNPLCPMVRRMAIWL